MNRHPWLILIAGGILGEVAGKMIVHDAFIVKHLGSLSGGVEWALRLGLAGAIMLIGWIVARRQRARDREATAR
jgi:predicted tellurium resistance membrane protein TerC